jgi:hypothetical protein
MVVLCLNTLKVKSSLFLMTFDPRPDLSESIQHFDLIMSKQFTKYNQNNFSLVEETPSKCTRHNDKDLLKLNKRARWSRGKASALGKKVAGSILTSGGGI